ncbi:MAG: hypothetical protein HC842_00315 [Cytophagales bacterium]|nr:hypothetical protein [Cytophagales bacterium]
MRLSPLLLAGLVLLSAACSQPKTEQAKTPPAYFALNSYLDQNLRCLAGQNLTLRKATVLNGAREQKTFSADSATWAAELAPLRRADLSAPALRDAYNQYDSAGWNVYQAKATAGKVKIKWLRLQLNDTGKLLAMDALEQERNLLFYSERRIELRSDAGHCPALWSYRVQGKQKMIFQDSLLFDVLVQQAD